MNMQLAVDEVRRQVEAVLRAYPELAEDEVLRADTLEGSTSILDMLDRLAGIEREASFTEEAIGERAKAISERKARFARRKEAVRGLMLELMQTAGMKSAPLPEVTLTVGNKRPSVTLINLDEVPDAFCKIARVPDKEAIAAALKSGTEVPGAVMSNGGVQLSVRGK